MVPVPCHSTAPVPPASYQRAVAKRTRTLHVDALALVTHLHVLALCRRAVQWSQRHCRPPFPKGPGRGASHLQRRELAFDRAAAGTAYHELGNALNSWEMHSMRGELPCLPMWRHVISARRWPYPRVRNRSAHYAGRNNGPFPTPEGASCALYPV